MTTHHGHRHRSIPHNPVALLVMLDLHQQITEAHAAVEQAEQQARQLEARMRRIPGLERLLPRRQFGQPVNIDALKRNLTAVSLLQRDPELASYLGLNTGAYQREAEERAARAMQAEAVAMRTARLREANQQRQQQRERFANAGISPLTGRRYGQ
jgi:hypothetical protein